MEPAYWYLIEFVCLVAVSGFFSGSESAFFSISEIEARKIDEEKEVSPSSRRVIRLLQKPGRLLNSILIGNTLVNVAAATVAALFTSRLLRGAESALLVFLIQVVVVTLILLIFSEITPKIIAVKRSLAFARAVSLPVSAAVLLFTPLSLLFEKMTAGAALFLKLKKDKAFVNEDEFKTLFEVSEESGALKASERQMIHSIFEFRDTTVKEVMVPRMDIFSVEKDTGIEAFLEIVRERGHSRVPVYDDKVDNILGILHVKDILFYTGKNQEVPPLKDLARKAYFVPESKGINELLKEFQQERNHMAVVVDEYGGTAGLITLEDVIEEIVGEIQDEYDMEKPLYEKAGENEWLFDGKICMEDLNGVLGVVLPEDEEFESLGGLVLQILGHIPDAGETFEYENLIITVEKVDKQRIEKVRIRVASQGSAAADRTQQL